MFFFFSFSFFLNPFILTCEQTSFSSRLQNKQKRSTEGALADCPKNDRVWVVVDRLCRFAWLFGSSFQLQPNDRPQHRQVLASFIFSSNYRVSRRCLKITATPQDGILFTATPYKANKRQRNTDDTANSHVSCCIGVAFLVTIPIYLIIRHIKGVDPKTPVLKSGSIFYCSLVIKYIE